MCPIYVAVRNTNAWWGHMISFACSTAALQRLFAQFFGRIKELLDGIFSHVQQNEEKNE